MYYIITTNISILLTFRFNQVSLPILPNLVFHMNYLLAKHSYFTLKEIIKYVLLNIESKIQNTTYFYLFMFVTKKIELLSFCLHTKRTFSN